MLDKFAFLNRRKKLLAKFSSGIAVIPNSNEVNRSNDVTYPYRYDSYFYYLTGFTEPHSVLILDFTNQKSILFCREKNKEEELWDGIRYGLERGRVEFGFDETYSIEEFNQKSLDLLIKTDKLFYTIGYNTKYDEIIINNLNLARKKSRSGIGAPTTIYDINHTLAEMRLIKDSSEIEFLIKTCEISSLAHMEAMRYIKKAQYEYQIEAKLLEVFYANGARYPAYQSIVAGGANACTLHYVTNNSKLNPGELLLIDAGSEYMGYAADITRTIPINGRFSNAQQAIYEIVLEANKQAINSVQVGNPWNKPSEVARDILIQGLIDLKLLSGTVSDNIENKNYQKFYMHGVGHWLGLDVHDAGNYKINGNWRIFEPGMCTTIEPGLYINKAPNIPEEYWNIGIRIEDDILLTEFGNTNLSHNIPKEIVEIERVINS